MGRLRVDAREQGKMKLVRSFVSGFVASLLLPAIANADLSSGVISSTRAIDWSQAGLPAGLPDATWTQCGATIAAYGGAPDTINTQIKSCASNQYVLLGPGTFNLSGSIDFSHKSNLVLRGSGANSTFLVFSASSTVDCNLGNSTLIAMCSTDQTDFWSNPPVFMWTDGLSQGSTQITLSATTGIVPGSMLFLSQDDDGYTGYPATGASVDNGSYFVCADAYDTNPTTGCAYNGPDGTYPSPFTHRWQYEAVVATAVTGNVVTISPSIRHPNWRAGQVPTAMVIQPLVSAGVEDLSIDAKDSSNVGFEIDISACNGCWVSGVTMKDYFNWGLGEGWSVHGQFQNNYVYNGDGTGSDPYGMRFYTTADNLIVNNIYHHIRASVVFDEPDVGTVLAYNYSVNQWTGSDAMFLAFWPHSAGDDYELFEGNVSNGIVMDSSHGGHLNETMYRNFNTGWESCANGNCGSDPTKDFGTTPTSWPYAMRYGNVIGNVSGTPGFHTVYAGSSFGGCSENQCAIYNLGEVNSAVTPPIPSDPLVASTMLRWGNWDTVTGDTRFCGGSTDTGWSSTCAGKSEVPTAAPVYPNTVPTKGDTAAGQDPLPASLYYVNKPLWFGSAPWPAIGPDVQNGNVGQCTGTRDTKGQYAGLPSTSTAQCTGTTMTSAWGGHVNATPAMACYIKLGGLPDGTGGLLNFDAHDCYGDLGPGPQDAGTDDDGSAPGDDGGGTTTDGGTSGHPGGGDAGGGQGGNGAAPGGGTGASRSSGGCSLSAIPLADDPMGIAALGGLAALVVRRRRSSSAGR
jgi:hypothetical protein